jgi:guanine deaminase
MAETSEQKKREFMARAISLSLQPMRGNQGGPFGAVIVKDGQIIGEGHNQVTTTNDPTAHAEVVAIRQACANLNSFQLDGCELYTSCEPCPMCLGAIYWARIERMFYGNSQADAAAIGFDDQFIYEEIGRELGDRRLPISQLMRDEANAAFQEWSEKGDRINY